MTSTEIVSGPTLAEKRFVAAYLASTREELADALANVSLSQASFRRDPGEWSIADIVEHLALIEGMVQTLLSLLPQGAPVASDRNDVEIDQFIIQNLPHRTIRAKAPEAAQPTGNWTLAEGLEDFARRRDDTVGLVEGAPCLRGRTMPHPIFGHWDGYQWMLAACAHTARHTAQIREIQSHQAFPKSPVRPAN